VVEMSVSDPIVYSDIESSFPTERGGLSAAPHPVVSGFR
jgi:hypothetical protein